jgi:ketosteroid isomerase-like protein
LRRRGRFLFLGIASALAACASPERAAILRLFDDSRKISLLNDAQQKAVILHDIHPHYVALVGAPTSPAPFNVSITSRDDYLKRFLPAFNATIRPRIRALRGTVDGVAIRGNTAYVTTTMTATIEGARGQSRDIKQRTHHFLVKVAGNGRPRWVLLSEVPESAESLDKEGARP